MRISFLGKGGSGKTTTAAAFIQYLASQYEHVLAIDADMNVHLQKALNIKGQAIPIGDNFQGISQYLNQNRNLDTTIIGSTPPNNQSQFVRPTKSDQLIQRYSLQSGNISLLTVGTYQTEDIGSTCYHGKLGSLEAIMHHLLDTKTDWVVADTTAGVDNLGTSLFFSYDLNVFIVEPTIKSVNVFKEFLEFSHAHDLNTMCIINKYEDDDKQFIENNIDSKYIIGTIPVSQYIKKIEQGDESQMAEYLKQNKIVFEKIVEVAGTINRNWQVYQANLNQMHTKISKVWYNDYYNQNLLTQIDPNFDYRVEVKKYQN